MNTNRAKCGTPFAYSECMAGVQEAAVLIAARYHDAAETLLRATLDESGGHECPQAWHMLLELLCLAGRRSEFETLAARYRGVFRESPPSWGLPKPIDHRSFALRGVIGPGLAELGDRLAAAGQGRKSLVIDMSEVERIEYAHLHDFQLMLGRVGASGVRVILANVGEVSATLLQAIGADRHVVIMRRKGVAFAAAPGMELAEAA